jgi:hypothetical protein
MRVCSTTFVVYYAGLVAHTSFVHEALVCACGAFEKNRQPLELCPYKFACGKTNVCLWYSWYGWGASLVDDFFFFFYLWMVNVEGRS